MWEAIRRNQRRSWILIGLMGLILLALGYLIGAAFHVEFRGAREIHRGAVDYTDMLDRVGNDSDPTVEGSYFSWITSPQLLLNRGGLIGMLIAAGIWAVMTLVALFGGDAVLLHSAGAKRIVPEQAPRLVNVVEEMTLAAGLSKIPDIYLIDDDRPNAFAVGRTPHTAAVAVTSGLVRRTTRDELQGVVAHEIAHIHNLDIRFMTLASVLVGSIVLISDLFLRSLWYGAGRRSSRSREGGGAQIVLLVVAVIFAIVAPILANLLYFACSRRREYLADACAARFTRYPPGLASALEKIGRTAERKAEIHRNLAPLYIVNPLQAHGASGWFSTHPPLDDRIRILRSMAGGADFARYEAAYQKLHGASSHCLDASMLADSTGTAVREPSDDTSAPDDALDRAREVLDVLDRAANFLILPCVCGVNLKLPPGLNLSTVVCPRCGHSNTVPHAESESPTEKHDLASRRPADDGPPQRYRRHTDGWESFRCRCGQTLQLSPSFGAKSIQCPKCRRRTMIES